MDDGQQNAWYAAQAQGASQPNMSWGQFDYSQQQDQSQHQQYGRDQSYYQQQNPYAQPQGYYGQMFVPGGGTAGVAAGDGEDYENEPPLLEELGINFSHIKEKPSLFSIQPAVHHLK